jgi:DNA-binding transcriptional MerR regulator
MERSIQEVARLAGTTSRTLRHYDDIGLLAPSSVGSNGYRRYDDAALLRLQRILLLRELGLGLPQIAEILAQQTDTADALSRHLGWLRQEHERIARQMASVRSTLETLKKGEQLMAEKMFDGFDHTRYEDEVTERWGADAYARGDAWWRGMDATTKAAWQQRSARLGTDWADAATRGVDPGSEEAQSLAERHVQWLREIPGTPAAAPGGDVEGYVLGLADMYVADPRFAANYGGTAGAEFVRDALRVHVARSL